MPDDEHLDEQLIRVLTEIRRRGGIGTQEIPDAIRHSEQFSIACPRDVLVGADLGSGGGLPGLVLAVRRPEIEWHLIERRGTRADLLRFGVRALGLEDRAHVHDADVAAFVRRGVAVDIVTARSFGPIATTLGAAASVLGPPTGARRRSQWIAISEPPIATAPDPGLLDELQLLDLGATQGIRRFERVFHVEQSPRSASAGEPAV